jgi:hypothetical protein
MDLCEVCYSMCSLVLETVGYSVNLSGGDGRATVIYTMIQIEHFIWKCDTNNLIHYNEHS